MYRYQVPMGVSTGNLSRTCSYVDLFRSFATWMCAQQQIPFNEMDCIQDNELVEMWISTVAAENKGKTRPASARTALNTLRKLHNLTELPVGGTITKLCKGATRVAATTTKQTLCIHRDNVKKIADAYSRRSFWFLRQIGTITVVGFVLLLRFGEARKLLKMGIRIITIHLQELTPCYISFGGACHVLPNLPPLQQVRAIDFCITSRKTSTTHSSWITASDRTLCGLILQHLATLRELGHVGKFLFPSRQRSAGTWIPNPTNPISGKTYVNCIRLALREVCHLPEDVCQGYTGHLLRVGGNNFVRKSDLTEDINRQLGDWASLSSCRGYNQLLISEKLKITDKLTLS